MRHRVRKFSLGRRPDHARAMLANQVCSLIDDGHRIQTTVAKAKETRRLAEKMVTLGKKGTLHHRRRAIAKLHNKDAVGRLFSDIAPRYLQREGGYTRIIRIGTRRGDGAQLCYLEWVEEKLSKASKKKAKKSQDAEVAEEAVAEEAVAEEAAAEEATEAAEEAAEEKAEEAAAEDKADESEASAEEADKEASSDEEKKED